jgi:hypothetical protein
MQNAQPVFRTDPSGARPISSEPVRRRSSGGHRQKARLLSACVFIAAMLFGASIAAQQVLMAPKVDATLDSVEVTGAADAIAVDYQLAETDWAWANDFTMDVWLGIYTSGADASDANKQWQLQRAQRLEAQQGEVSFEDAVGAGTDEIGLCLIVASVGGGKLAPGMGYVCETPLVVSTADGRLDFETKDASVTLSFERNVDQQPWYSAERGFDQAEAAETGDEQSAGEFFSYRAPSPPEDVRGVQTRRQERGDQHRSRMGDRDQRRIYAYPDQRMVIYTPGYLPGFFFDGDRVDVDRFRQRRLERRRIFGPLDGFDAKFNQDMFESHPEGVFYNQPIPPGYFGRDAFGRDLQNGFGAPPGVQRRLQDRGLGQPFE